MDLPRPTDTLAGCVWLPRILAKARLSASGGLPEDYASRFCNPSGVDGKFLAHFGLAREDVMRASGLPQGEAATWFWSLPAAADGGIERWNHVAVNLGRSGFPMAERLPVALATTYSHLRHLGLDTVFAVLEEDERDR